MDTRWWTITESWLQIPCSICLLGVCTVFSWWSHLEIYVWPGTLPHLGHIKITMWERTWRRTRQVLLGMWRTAFQVEIRSRAHVYSVGSAAYKFFSHFLPAPSLEVYSTKDTCMYIWIKRFIPSSHILCSRTMMITTVCLYALGCNVDFNGFLRRCANQFFLVITLSFSHENSYYQVLSIWKVYYCWYWPGLGVPFPWRRIWFSYGSHIRSQYAWSQVSFDVTHAYDVIRRYCDCGSLLPQETTACSWNYLFGFSTRYFPSFISNLVFTYDNVQVLWCSQSCSISFLTAVLGFTMGFG